MSTWAGSSSPSHWYPRTLKWVSERTLPYPWASQRKLQMWFYWEFFLTFNQFLWNCRGPIYWSPLGGDKRSPETGLATSSLANTFEKGWLAATCAPFRASEPLVLRFGTLAKIQKQYEKPPSAYYFWNLLKMEDFFPCHCCFRLLKKVQLSNTGWERRNADLRDVSLHRKWEETALHRVTPEGGLQWGWCLCMRESVGKTYCVCNLEDQNPGRKSQ